MDKKNIATLLIKIEDDSIWENMIELSATKLVVIDCHPEWCGCCEAMFPSMSRILIDYDSPDERFQYCTASIAKLSSKMQSSFPTDAHINLEKNGCLPLFAIFRHKTCVQVIQGVDSPTLLAQIAANMPEKPVKE